MDKHSVRATSVNLATKVCQGTFYPTPTVLAMAKSIENYLLTGELDDEVTKGIYDEGFAEGKLAGEDYYDDQTLLKVHNALELDLGWDREAVIDAVNVLQNRGILFRERR